jgi:glyoxylase-like metal-dependent hydrolase (beta-lactamase superfamily II)
MREILEGIFIWSRLAEPQGYDFNGYFIRHPDGNLVIDPVEPEPDGLEAMADQGVARILITNRNHSRAANRVREETGALTAIHPSDADHARAQGCVIDEAFSVGETIGPLMVLPADGKSPGEVALYWRDRRLLFLGDAAIGNPPGRCALLPDAKLDNPARLRASLRALLDVDFDALLFGDGTPILTGAKACLAELVESFPDE